MDFKKFQQWCENKGFVVKMPSGYSKLINLEVSSFESFKGIFNLCMMFFYEELHKQRDEEMKQCLKNLNNQPIALYKDGDNEPSAYYTSDNEGISTLERIYDHDKVNKKTLNRAYKEDKESLGSFIYRLMRKVEPKYNHEDFEKVFDYLLTPDASGGVPMDELLDSLGGKYQECRKYTGKSNWCDLGKETYQRELKNPESGD